MKGQLEDFITNSNFCGNEILQFSMFSRYDSCSRCEFTVNEILNLLEKVIDNKIPRENNSNNQIQEFTFISINPYEKKKKDQTLHHLQKYDGPCFYSLSLTDIDKKKLRRLQSLQKMLGKLRGYFYDAKSQIEINNVLIPEFSHTGIISEIRNDTEYQKNLLLNHYNEFAKCYEVKTIKNSVFY